MMAVEAYASDGEIGSKSNKSRKKQKKNLKTAVFQCLHIVSITIILTNVNNFPFHLLQTMTLTSVLQSFQGVVMANLNFSSRTTPEIILKTFAQYCSYTRRGKDIYLEPAENLGAQSWLVVFCDEINVRYTDFHTFF